jgi:hypothetical protein
VPWPVSGALLAGIILTTAAAPSLPAQAPDDGARAAATVGDFATIVNAPPVSPNPATPSAADRPVSRLIAAPPEEAVEGAGGVSDPRPTISCEEGTETGPAQAADRLFDTLSVFAGIDGSKTPQDLGINANFGGRVAVNWGLPLWRELGLGAQIGTAVNYARTAVSVLEEVGGPGDRTSVFTTVALFERLACGLKGGIGYDFLDEDYYNHIDVGQWRCVLGYDLGPRDELGVWATKGDRGHEAFFDHLDLHLRPVTEGNLYYRHTWPGGVRTGFWLGVAEEHGRFVLVFPGRPNIHHPVVFGADLHVPLSERLALFGEANFITPNDTGTVDATLGVAYFFGPHGGTASRPCFAPLLPVANNATFTLDLQQQ